MKLISKIKLKLRWWLGLYDKSGVTPVTYEAFEEMYLRHPKWDYIITGTHPSGQTLSVMWEDGWRPRRDRPCKNHRSSYPSLGIPEVKHFKDKLSRCKKCGWYHK